MSLTTTVQIDIIFESRTEVDRVYKVVGWLKNPNSYTEKQRRTFGYIRKMWSGGDDEVFWEAAVWKNGTLVPVTTWLRKPLSDAFQCVHAMFGVRYGSQEHRPAHSNSFAPFVQRDDTGSIRGG
tara:strand:+ start:35 stop:406 length:372 start_codon:yes stop_codon:yes gene_type:complete